jgi:hypothetical protein
LLLDFKPLFLVPKPDRSDIPDEIGIQRRAGANALMEYRFCFSEKIGYELLFLGKQVWQHLGKYSPAVRFTACRFHWV